LEALPDVGVLSHARAVAEDGNQVAMVDEAIDERGSHDASPKISHQRVIS